MGQTILQIIYFEDSRIPLESRQKVFARFGTVTRCVLSSFESNFDSWTDLTQLLGEEVGQAFLLYGIIKYFVVSFAFVGIINGIFFQKVFDAAAADDFVLLRQKDSQLQEVRQ